MRGDFMIKRQSPTIYQANLLFFITAVATLAGSAFFQPKLGLGTNLWINEFVYILIPPLLLARFYKWPVEDVYRFNKTSARNKVISIFSGMSLWFFAFYISKITGMFLDSKIGVFIIPEQVYPSIYQSFLLLIGMIVLAPICEEIFFRGFVQRAYEGYSRRYAFVIAGIIFGSYHILNGISEVIPACILGLGMGYLLYKTDSIANSMLFHFAVNTSAIVFGGVLTTSTNGRIPVWLHIIAFVGLGLSLVLLKRVKGEKGFSGCQDEVQQDNRMPVKAIVFLALSGIFLIAVGVLEVLARLGILKV
jgi:uncharacterized protein